MKIVVALLLFFGVCAYAGNQKEEVLADSVHVALSRAITDGGVPKVVISRSQYMRWLNAMSARLQKKIVDVNARHELLETVWYEATRAGLDPSLVLGLMQVESAFRQYAVSVAGARGYMQVMPFWAKLIGDGDARKLFQMQLNLRYGCVILRHYLDVEAGNLYFALGRYNGSRGQAQYPRAVMSAWKQFKFD